MGLEEVAFLAEIGGVILIVVSLIYVAQQLRQNTDMARVAKADAAVQRGYDIVNPMIQDKELAKIWLQGGDDFGSLDEVDQQRLVFFEWRALTWWHHVFQVRQDGLYSDADWYNQLWLIQTIGRRQAIRAAWSAFKDGYEEPFRAFLDEQFEIGDRNAA